LPDDMMGPASIKPHNETPASPVSEPADELA
jgi:hypothetical protein